MVSEAIAMGDVNAINYFLGQAYVAAFEKLASSPQAKTVIIPAEFSGIMGTIEGIRGLTDAAKAAQADRSSDRRRAVHAHLTTIDRRTDMDTVFSQLNHWHWLVLGLILFGVEMMTGTFDLLMVSIAAFVTAAVAAAMPQIGWEMQALVFALSSVALFHVGPQPLLRAFAKAYPSIRRLTGAWKALSVNAAAPRVILRKATAR